MIRQLFILFITVQAVFGAAARDLPMSLDEAIALARVRSVDAAEASYARPTGSGAATAPTSCPN